MERGKGVVSVPKQERILKKRERGQEEEREKQKETRRGVESGKNIMKGFSNRQYLNSNYRK